jgi:hypothetical protein
MGSAQKIALTRAACWGGMLVRVATVGTRPAGCGEEWRLVRARGQRWIGEDDPNEWGRLWWSEEAAADGGPSRRVGKWVSGQRVGLMGLIH